MNDFFGNIIENKAQTIFELNCNNKKIEIQVKISFKNLHQKEIRKIIIQKIYLMQIMN